MKDKIGWIATAFLMVATVVRSFNISHELDLFCTFMGCLLWAIDAYRIKSTPLIVVNVFCTLAILAGVIWRGFA